MSGGKWEEKKRRRKKKDFVVKYLIYEFFNFNFLIWAKKINCFLMTILFISKQNNKSFK